MIMRRPAEEFLAELENILARFRTENSGMVPEGSGHEEAVRRLRELGFTAGQSLELLRGRQERKPKSVK